MTLKYRRYNWNKLKIKYFKSPELTVRGFLEANYPTVNGHMLKMTTGWYTAKLVYQQEYQNILNEKHQQKVINQEVNRLTRAYKNKWLKELALA